MLWTSARFFGTILRGNLGRPNFRNIPEKLTRQCWITWRLEGQMDGSSMIPRWFSIKIVCRNGSCPNKFWIWTSKKFRSDRIHGDIFKSHPFCNDIWIDFLWKCYKKVAKVLQAVLEEFSEGSSIEIHKNINSCKNNM